MVAGPLSDAPRFAPSERPRISIAGDGTLAAIVESSRIVIVTLPAGAGLAEIGTDREAGATELGWVGPPARLVVLSRHAGHSTVHLLDPYGPRSVAEIRLESPMRLFATVGPHALAVGAQGAAVLTAGEAHLTPYQFPARGIPIAAGSAGGLFLVALPGAIEEWDPQSRMPKRRLRLPRPAAITAVGGSERLVWMTTQQQPNRIDVISLVTRGQPKAHDLPEPIAHASGHPRSDLLVCLGAESQRIYVVDLDGRKRLRTMGLPGLERVEAAALVVGRTIAALGAQVNRPLALLALDDAPFPGDAAAAGGAAPASPAAPAGATPERPREDDDEAPPKPSTLSDPDFLPPMPVFAPALTGTRAAGGPSLGDAFPAGPPAPGEARVPSSMLGDAFPAGPPAGPGEARAPGGSLGDAFPAGPGEARAPGGSLGDAFAPGPAPPEVRPGDESSPGEARSLASPASGGGNPSAPGEARPAGSPASPVPSASRASEHGKRPSGASPSVGGEARPRGAAAPPPVVIETRPPGVAAAARSPLGFTPAGAPASPSRQAAVGAPVAAPAAADAARWRDEVVAWARAAFAGTQREAPAAPPIDALAARFDLSPPLRRALILLYGAHLCGEPGAAPVDVARACDRGWDEALGRGRLAEARLAIYERSRVRLAAPILRALDELPPAAGALFGAPGPPALLALWAAVAPGEPLEELAARLALQIGGAILAARPGAEPAELYLEARARGAIPLLRLADGAEPPPPEQPAILAVDDDAAADRLGAPIL